MTFLEELEVVRRQGFTKDEGPGWEATFERAYQNMRDYILGVAANIVREARFNDNDKPIVLHNGKDRSDTFGLSNKMMALLAERFKQDGLTVETFDVEGRFYFQVYLPKLPDYYRVSN